MKDYLLVPRSRHPIQVPHGEDTIEYITKTCGRQRSKYYCEGTKILLDKPTDDKETQES